MMVKLKCPDCKKRLLRIQREEDGDYSKYWMDVGYICPKCKKTYKEKTILVEVKK